MTLAVAHLEASTERVVIDCLRRFNPPFSPEAVVSDSTTCLKSYGLSAATGDRFGGEWPVEQFSKFGVRYVPAAKPKSDLYRDLLPLLNSGRLDLLDHKKMIGQLVSLERRTARGGKDSIDHPSGQHDDLSNVVAGAASLCVTLGGSCRSLPIVPVAMVVWRKTVQQAGDGFACGSTSRIRCDLTTNKHQEFTMSELSADASTMRTRKASASSACCVRSGVGLPARRRRYRVPVHMMDARVVDTSGDGGLGLQRPGFRRVLDVSD